jgi:Xaa-Pro dipeptidase
MDKVEQSELLSRNGYPRFSETEFKRRHQTLRQMMEQEDTDVVVFVESRDLLSSSIQYLTNWQPLLQSFLIFPRIGEPVLLVQLFNHLLNAQEISIIPDVRYAGELGEEPWKNVVAELKKRGFSNKTIGFVGSFTLREVQRLTSYLPEAALKDFSHYFQQLRLIKSEEEMNFAKISAEMSDRAVEALEQRVEPGLKEYELGAIIEDAYNAERGANWIHFVLTTPMEDPNMCVPRQHLSDRAIRSGDVLVTEISTDFWGYTGQILRSFTIDAEPTPLYQELYEVALSTYKDIVSVLRDGTHVQEILDRADQIDETGYSIWDDLFHGFVGGYGPPVLRTRQTGSEPPPFTLKKDMVVVVQPNVITRDERAGVQVGDAMRITESGVTPLHDYPMKFIRCS